ncbi:hypothetical protein O185_14075 [Photorhabdus temperata J3]|uniref:Uncharacterized protein n=1 Tax=Photorhabdus temperata J3 TaxID=1389415 RepID=U7R1N5_PHOTE|nr:hypothetical protein O185_14075 [Photorhabdus temperata J3]
MTEKNTREYKEAVIHCLVSPVNLTVSQERQVYAGYGGNEDPTLLDRSPRIGASAGALLGGLLAYPMFDAVRQALPMMQAVILNIHFLCFYISYWNCINSICMMYITKKQMA